MRNGNKIDQLRCQYSCGNRQNNQTISNSYTYKFIYHLTTEAEAMSMICKLRID